MFEPGDLCTVLKSTWFYSDINDWWSSRVGVLYKDTEVIVIILSVEENTVRLNYIGGVPFDHHAFIMASSPDMRLAPRMGYVSCTSLQRISS